METNKELKAKHEKLRDEFETYQSFAESNIQMINEKNAKLEKKLDALSSIIEISKYINSNVRDSNFIIMINDMIMGILGVMYSTIYLIENGVFTIKATNVPEFDMESYSTDYFALIDKNEPFIVNSRNPIFEQKQKSEKVDIRSIVGLPISLREECIGYVIVEHTLYNFFNHEHIKYISSIANQIGIAIENNILYTKVKESSVRDPLIGIYNRRYFFDELESKLKNEPSRAFAIVMIDIDDFKKVNDVFGHQFGDEVLIQTVKLIENNVDKQDIVARYGGEEIVIYVNKATSKEQVINKIEDIRKKIGENIISYGCKKSSVTASFGISYYPENSSNIDEIVDIADKLLYEAKRLGKNRVISA